MLVSTDEVEPAWRFEYWQHVLFDRFGGTQLRRRADDGQPFRARLVAVELGELTFCRVTGRPADVVRPTAVLDAISPEACRFHIEIPLRGTARLSQAGREATLRPGDFVLCDNGLPFCYGFSSYYDELVIQIPRRMLLAREPRADQLTAVTVRGDNGLGALLSPALRRAAKLESWSGSPAACVFAAQLIDLVATALSAQLGPVERRVARSRYLAQAQAYLHDHLGEPDLSPERAAAAVGISPRYLYALFHDQGTTVTRWLTERRLERSRQLLSSRQHAALTITEVAAAVGFRDLSHFSNSFKSAFGVSPRAFRASARSS
jgi:AraC-like DNA-binding protein